MEQGKNNILRHAYSYMGRDLDKREKFLVLYTGGRVNEADEKAVVMTVLEAMADDWRIIVNGKWRTLDCAIRAGWRVDGRLSNMRYDDIGKLVLGPLERGVLMLRGTVFCPMGMVENDWQRNRETGDELLSVLADACIFVNEVPFKTLRAMLDNDVECAILRGALRTRTGRKAASEGAPVIDSYSSWAKMSKTIAWEAEDGAVNLLDLRVF